MSDNVVIRPFERKELDPHEVFKNYLVEDTKEKWAKHLAKITSVKFWKEKDNDYSCDVCLCFQLDGELFNCKYFYEKVLTKGRDDFERLFISFRAVKKNEDTTYFADIPALLGKYGYLYLNALNCPKMILPASIESDEELQIQKELDENVDVEISSEELNIPAIFQKYVIIAVHKDYSAGHKYHAAIMDYSCKDSTVRNDVDVKLSLVVFNGGDAKFFAKFFNQIRGKGREGFDDFCKRFGLVRENGTIDLSPLDEPILCRVTLTENKKGNLYVDTLSPLYVEDEVTLSQYNKLLESI